MSYDCLFLPHVHKVCSQSQASRWQLELLWDSLQAPRTHVLTSLLLPQVSLRRNRQACSSASGTPHRTPQPIPGASKPPLQHGSMTVGGEQLRLCRSYGLYCGTPVTGEQT